MFDMLPTFGREPGTALTTFELSVLFFLQLAIILAVCRLVGRLVARLGQPQVVGEMIAGVVLGPSLFGLLLPETARWVFPSESRPIIYAFSQVGVSLYMFLVGVEFDVGLIRSRLRSAASVSIAGMATPFVLGALLALTLDRSLGLFTHGVTSVEAALYLGAAMCITAFPMLARIIYERGLSGTSLGTLALAAGSMDDAAAWCILAVVLASFSDNVMVAGFAIGGGIGYAIFMLVCIRPMLKPIGAMVERTGELTPTMLSTLLCVAMLGAWFTDLIGIYAVFGAFIAGIAVPRGKLTEELQRQLAPMVTVFLLPMFFIYSGLNTRITLVNTWTLWGVALVVLLAACLGKGVACWAAARMHGEPRRDAVAIGALMNARGLMELIILNIGLERGVITPRLFSIMVIMAIVTTLLATPVFEMVYGRTGSSRRMLLRERETEAAR